MEGYQQGGGRARMGKKIQGSKNINGSYKKDRERLKIVKEMERPKTYMHDPWT